MYSSDVFWNMKIHFAISYWPLPPFKFQKDFLPIQEFLPDSWVCLCNLKYFIYLKIIRVRATCQSDVNIFFVFKKSVVDAIVDIFFALVATSRNEIRFLQNCKILKSVRIRNPQKGNFLFDVLLPRKGRESILAGN